MCLPKFSVLSQSSVKIVIVLFVSVFFSVAAVLLPNVHILPDITAAFHAFNTKSSYILNCIKN
jgi:hypothetical protein